MENNRTILKSQQQFRSELRNVLRENVNRITLNANDDKRIQVPGSHLMSIQHRPWKSIQNTIDKTLKNKENEYN